MLKEKLPARFLKDMNIPAIIWEAWLEEEQRELMEYSASRLRMAMD